MFELRDYQRETVDAIESAALRLDRVVVVHPTGAGKTVTFAHLAAAWVERGARVLILVHRDELVRQTVAKLHALLPGELIGVIKAERNDSTAQVVVASVQTVSRDNRLAQLSAFQLCIVDEAHHAAADTYVKILTYLGAWERRCFVVGFTATLMRADTRGLGDVWQEVVDQRSILWMIKRGHLVDVRGKSVPIDGLNLDGVKRSAGDFQARDLATELSAHMVPQAVAEAYEQHAPDRTGVLFAPTVESAYQFADSLNDRDIVAETVHAGILPEERQQIYTRLRHGDTRVVTNCSVLTEGWDEPSVSCCVIARPTSSAGLYIQMVGRVLRPFAAGGKVDALVLDVTGAARKHSLATLGTLTESSRKLVDGQSLLELEDELEAAGDGGRVKKLITSAQLEDVDLFARSTSVWLRTTDQVWFIPAGDHLVFLWENVDGESVACVADKFGNRGEKLSDGLPLDMAMAVGEQRALDLDHSIASKRSSWRQRKEPASQAQLAILGGDAPAGVTKRDASDLISVTFASRALKRFAPSKG